MSGLCREFDLVAACCRWPRSPAGADLVRALADGADWNRFVRVVRRHRVAGMVTDGLRAAGVQPPEAVATALKGDAGRSAMQTLSRVTEALRLQALLDEAGLPAMFIKGESLAMRVYGILNLKQARDIDLLVMPQDIARARAVLEQAGYAVAKPAGLTPEQFETFTTFGRECLMIHRQSRIFIDLHWRLTDNAQFLPGVTAGSPANLVPMAGDGAALRTLSDPDLFAFLCLHGAQHGWARLKWLVDVAAWLGQEGEAGIERLFRASVERGAGRPAGQALLLSQRFLGLALPTALETELRADPVLRRLEAVGVGILGYGDGEREVNDDLLPALRIMASQHLLGRGWRYRASLLTLQWRGDWDRVHIPLPRPLHFLYHLIRAPSWLWRRLAAVK